MINKSFVHLFNGYDFYAFCSQQYGLYKFSNMYGHANVNCKHKIKSNDKLKIELNTKNKTLKLYINHKDLNIIFNDINFSNHKIYNIAEALTKATSIKLIDFHHFAP